jgi:hypothetical protein
MKIRRPETEAKGLGRIEWRSILELNKPETGIFDHD